jgi:hypothetical protein
MLINSILVNKPEIMSKHCGEKIIHLGARTYMLPDEINYRVYTVSKAHVARPDLISKMAYGDPMYGDVICKINGISNPFELNEGMMLIVPDISDVIGFRVVDDYSDDIDQYSNNDKPKPKKKNEKRKANEAIVGDTRFKIDKDKRVIIY